jgi:hypothetical protein
VSVQKDRRVCRSILLSYPGDVVLDNVMRFLEETMSELISLEVRTEYGQQDPPEFARYLVDRHGDHLIR